MRFIAHLYAS